MSDTPRTDEFTFDVVVKRGDAHLMREHYKDGSGDFVESDFARQLEHELNAANSKIELLMSANADVARIADERDAAENRIPLLIAERDTARRQADQNWKLREEFRELLGTDDVEQGVAVVREMKERISKLYDYVAALETGGDLMANELSFGYDVDLWNKARGEAKP